MARSKMEKFVQAKDVSRGMVAVFDGIVYQIDKDAERERYMGRQSLKDKRDAEVCLFCRNVRSEMRHKFTIPGSKEVRILPTETFNLIDMNDEGFLTLVDENCAVERSDLHVDLSSNIARNITRYLEDGEDIEAIVAKSDNEELVIACNVVEEVKTVKTDASEKKKIGLAGVSEQERQEAAARRRQINFCEAVCLGDIAEAKKFLDSGLVDVNAEASSGKLSPINLALFEGHDDMIKMLLEYKPDLTKRASDGATSLHIAVDKSSLHIVRRMLKVKDIDVNAPDAQGWTPLHIAASRGRFEVVKFLVEEGKADVNALTMNEWNPLHAAANSGHGAVCGMLLSCGSDAGALNGWSLTPLCQAERAGKSSAVERFFEDPWQVAVETDNVRLAKCLALNRYEVEDEDTNMIRYESLMEFASSQDMRNVIRECFGNYSCDNYVEDYMRNSTLFVDRADYYRKHYGDRYQPDYSG